MGLSSFPCSAEGVLPVLVLNTVLSVLLLKNMLRSVLQVIGAASSSGDSEEQDLYGTGFTKERRISTTRFRSLCGVHGSVPVKNNGGSVECCVCLCRFEEEEEVSELSCKHFFHKSCLDKWFHNQHTTCPLCRSIN